MKKLIRSEKGQGLVEYALILVLVAIVVLAVLLLMGPVVGNAFSNIVTNLEKFSGGGSGVIQSATASYLGGNLRITVRTSTTTNLIISGAVSQPSNPCPGNNCTFNFGGAPSSGSATITATSGGTTTVSW